MEPAADRTAVVVAAGSWSDNVLESVLQQAGVRVLADATDTDDVAEIVATVRPDLVVGPASGDGWGWLRATKEQLPSVRVVVVGPSRDPGEVESAFEAGATAYVVARSAGDDLAVAVRQSFERSLYLAGGPAAARPGPAHTKLTKRELEIVIRVAHGRSNREIARELWLTEQTIKFHLSNVYRKLGVRNRTSASRWVHENGLLDDEPVQAPR